MPWFPTSSISPVLIPVDVCLYNILYDCMQTWSTPAEVPQTGGGVANGEGGAASMDVFDTILQDIESFTGDLAQSTAKADPAQQEVNGE